MGAFENAKGKIKERVGDLTDNDALRAEGEAQRRKGEEQQKANEDAAKAKAHEKGADLAESRMD